MKRIILLALLLALLILAACNLPTATPTVDPADQLFTQAAQTVAAQLTANAPIVTPTLAAPILPTNTPFVAVTPQTNPATPTPLCDLAEFVADITVPDGTQFKPGETFTKKWRLRNQGTCTWTTGYALVFDEGDPMGADLVINLPADVPPGSEVDVAVEMTAPNTPGTYRGYWRVRNEQGVLFPVLKGYKGKSFYVEIEVVPQEFAVTSVRYTGSTVDNPPTYQGCPLVVAEIVTNGAGTVTYKWIHSDTADPAAVPTETLTFDGPGSKLTPAHAWYVTSATPGPYWVQIYIDQPNHQYFSQFSVTPCAAP
jgi:hypothetical protein